MSLPCVFLRVKCRLKMLVVGLQDFRCNDDLLSMYWTVPPVNDEYCQYLLATLMQSLEQDKDLLL